VIAQTPVALERDGITARVLPEEGGVLLDLMVQGRAVLASTPWAASVRSAPRPAVSEAQWVERWRGGWQLCFPTAGQPNPATGSGIGAQSRVPDGFHGAASQTPWLEVSRATDSVTLGWADSDGLSVGRLWQLTEDGATVTTRVHNSSSTPRVLVIAEHLILGGEVIAEPLTLEIPEGTQLRPLDYAGLPEGSPSIWPGDPADRWTIIDQSTPARVTGLAQVEPKRITARGSHVTVNVQWRGDTLPHALLWQELGVSTEHPWNGQVRALGIEPSSTPHGAGTALDQDLIRLAPDDTLDWSVALQVKWNAETKPVGTTKEVS